MESDESISLTEPDTADASRQHPYDPSPVAKFVVAKTRVKKTIPCFSWLVYGIIWVELAAFLLMVTTPIWITQKFIFVPIFFFLQLVVVLHVQMSKDSKGSNGGWTCSEALMRIYHDPLLLVFGNVSYLGLQHNETTSARVFITWTGVRSLLLLALYLWGHLFFFKQACKSTTQQSQFCDLHPAPGDLFHDIEWALDFRTLWHSYFEMKGDKSSTPEECRQAGVPKWLDCDKVNATHYAECLETTPFHFQDGCNIDALSAAFSELYFGRVESHPAQVIRMRLSVENNDTIEAIRKFMARASILMFVPFVCGLLYSTTCCCFCCRFLEKDDDADDVDVAAHWLDTRLFFKGLEEDDDDDDDDAAEADDDVGVAERKLDNDFNGGALTEDEYEQITEAIEQIKHNKTNKTYLTIETVSFYAGFSADIFNVITLINAGHDIFPICWALVILNQWFSMIRDDFDYRHIVKQKKKPRVGDFCSGTKPLVHCAGGLYKEYQRSRKRGLMTDRFLSILYRTASGKNIYSVLFAAYTFPFMISTSYGIPSFFFGVILSMKSIVRAAYIRFHLGSHGVFPMAFLMRKYGVVDYRLCGPVFENDSDSDIE